MICNISINISFNLCLRKISCFVLKLQANTWRSQVHWLINMSQCWIFITFTFIQLLSLSSLSHLYYIFNQTFVNKFSHQYLLYEYIHTTLRVSSYWYHSQVTNNLSFTKYHSSCFTIISLLLILYYHSWSRLTMIIISSSWGSALLMLMGGVIPGQVCNRTMPLGHAWWQSSWGPSNVFL